jgi:hypothetical protein
MSEAGTLPERRTAGEIAQPGCTMTGFLFLLAEIEGDHAVVVFGERDCANAFPRIMPFTKRRPWNVFSVSLSQIDAVAGSAEERLADCLRAVAISRRPRAILVLGTCLSDMIGADPQPACRRVQDETGIRIVWVPTSGLQPRTQAQTVDWMVRTLLTELGEDGVRDPDGVNLVGYQTGADVPWTEERMAFREEVVDLLDRMGLRLNAAAPSGATMADWTGLPRAALTAVSDRAVFGSLMDLLESSGQASVELPQPKGISATDAFYLGLARAAGRDATDILQAYEGRAAAVLATAGARMRWAGRRLAYGIGSHHNFRSDQLAQEGLADLPLLLELGFRIDLVIQERDTSEGHQRIQRNLAAMSVDLPYRFFAEPAALAPVLEAGGYDLVYLSSFLRGQAVRVGIPMVEMGRFPSGYRGASESCRILERAGTPVFERRFGRWSGGRKGEGA